LGSKDMIVFTTAVKGNGLQGLAYLEKVTLEHMRLNQDHNINEQSA